MRTYLSWLLLMGDCNGSDLLKTGWFLPALLVVTNYIDYKSLPQTIIGILECLPDYPILTRSRRKPVWS